MRERTLREKNLENGPNVRQFPGPREHKALAIYWGAEAAAAMQRVADGTSQYPDLDALHAWRVSKVAWYHMLKHVDWRKDDCHECFKRNGEHKKTCSAYECNCIDCSIAGEPTH